ncbi:MAG TPA: hybrid sensor histidine kinase/response regulator [Prolixibacteraceae bacterium]|jgi:signal transduction histidine kinase|nr:hybrid sensor histidine kinase/response regulator [Prolixibacteraceae bacterium]
MNNPIKVLIIEDNQDDAKLEMEELKSGGFDIDFELIESRKAMKEALNKKSWDCIISDYSLPQFSGLDALEELKETGQDIPFILISGTIGEETAVAAMKAGAHDYIMKDNLTRLVPAFDRELREAKVRHQKRQADKALIESYNDLIQQNAEYQVLNIEYQSQNIELKDSLDHIRDINTELVISKNKAEESDKFKSAFLANMSHEIRTPLNGILGFSSFLKDPDLTKEKTERYIHIIESSGQQLLTIINDILDISKIEAGQMDITLEATDIKELLKELLQQFIKEAELKNLDLILNPAHLDEPIVASTDENRLRQVFCNLMSNAIKFTSEGTIEFGLSQKGNFIEFYVKDSGIGISTEDQSVIFEPFRKVASKTNQLFGGTGLGLAISKALVEKLGGTLSVTSSKNEGATFIFTIPYMGSIDTNPEQPAKTISITQNNMSQKTILVAEDEIFNFYYIEELLKPLNIKTLHAKNGLEAVEMAKANPDVSLVLMDIRMPEMDGLAATKLIKEMRPQLPVIAQTAFASREDKENAKSSGFDHYLSKPIVRDLFMEVIGKYLD